MVLKSGPERYASSSEGHSPQTFRWIIVQERTGSADAQGRSCTTPNWIAKQTLARRIGLKKSGTDYEGVVEAQVFPKSSG